ncbi:hypothetical protein COCC4DRAFT_200873 [Bipolaris maydis ATCC 48331]|uniref:Zn(2)-C6 fungal-type domain-containing protein n=3 Tax=Cochliobolus heterostrophus TaxID=5016 RepID=M2UWA0_COCH5|nr:uncharacterized protein COCC4DRAFT_200873 [Bipolaris maydis ATCC 48331]EMD97811.1 hypothetical protein COCHEDRAFT_1125721 [Bipolaris maydis C5]KAJ5031882.1 fungal-specific transcription factor domain-containing protein [Bipolaris maydis]ENI02793.1 hypothetical protein COCC4DRAFT_200873 [Bipolaris maydis ATCC 48331]KAJ5060055.1 fungal-specific transcription factor domain-containing protein [Bipolaris maydis]KAJ6202147.1 fungal-specific transcription factor domain-containing protein [Bipolari
MPRGPAAASSARDSQDHAPPQDAKTTKRRCVQSACVPCRKRKSKCDGGTPVCATCTAVYKTECYYDAESESRRTKAGQATSNNAGTKRDASSVTSLALGGPSNADFILNCLRELPEDHVTELIQLVRGNPDLDNAALAETWRKNVTLAPNTPTEGQSLESDFSVILGKPAVTLSGQSRHFGHSASLSLVHEEENFSGGQLRISSVQPERQGSTWTNVTDDLAFVERLLDIYFTWSHPFYVLLSRECFYKDFRAGRDKYCCSLLVNAICAYACHMTDDPAGRTDPSNFRTAGDHFFEEARRLLFEDETPSLTTVQALCIMSLREPSTGRDSSGFSYIGRCIRMCVELGLHLDYGVENALGLTPSEIEVRKVTFWGCFTVENVWTIATGRITQIPRSAITLEKPILDEITSGPEAFPGTSHTGSGVVTSRMFLQELSTLSELINDNNHMFFAPKERFTSTRLLDCYYKYQAWYRKLPISLGIEGNKEPQPHILALHMFYYTNIIHLFRPLLKVDLIQSDIRPRDICIDAANNVSRIIRIHRKFYTFRQAHLVVVHVLLTVCTIHLLYSKENQVARQNLIEGLQGLEDIHECHYFGARAFRIIHNLAKTWNLPFPEEFSNSTLLPKNDSENSHRHMSPPEDARLMMPNSTASSVNHTGPRTVHSAQSQRRESLSMFAPQNMMHLATHPAHSRPSSVVATQRHASPAVRHEPIQSNYNSNMSLPYQYAQPMSSATNMSASITSPTADTAESMFWNPMPSMPGPILPRHNYQQIGPMGLESVLHGGTNLDDRLVRDGFRINEDWRSSHVNGFNTGVASNVYSAPNSQHEHSYAPRQTYAAPTDGVGYPSDAHDGHHGHRGHHGQDEYNSTWWQNADAAPGHMGWQTSRSKAEGEEEHTTTTVFGTHG